MAGDCPRRRGTSTQFCGGPEFGSANAFQALMGDERWHSPAESYCLASRTSRPGCRFDRWCSLLRGGPRVLPEGAPQHLHRRLGHRQPHAALRSQPPGGRLSDRVRSIPRGTGQGAARAADPSSAVGLLPPLRGRARGAAATLAAMEDAGAHHAVSRRHRADRLLATPEDRGGRRCRGPLGWPRPHDPAVGHPRPRPRQPQPRRSVRAPLSAFPRRADDGRRRGGAGAGALGAPALVSREWRRAGGRAPRRSVAGKRQAGFHRRRYRYRPDAAPL